MKSTMREDRAIVIRSFQPKDQVVTKALILDGMREHWGAIDPAKNTDLDNIAYNYGEEIFLVALSNDEIVGTGALVKRGNHTAEIVRMSVKAAHRRQGIGNKLLDALVDRAKVAGMQRIILETTSTWDEAIEFYRHYGFQITHRKDGNIFFELAGIN